MQEVLEVEKKLNFLQHDIIGIMVMLSITNNTSNEYVLKGREWETFSMPSFIERSLY
jgi:hypothetical protein